ncbi:MAG TPA: S-adenosylmethionine:tRNA ribosyltransferase-isomerase [Propionibacteriaceae bacterium]|nr:S-adenosylmethionine:tRNA ribosyltransferase-isomerase [Propionibacteriaceae bacterium]
MITRAPRGARGVSPRELTQPLTRFAPPAGTTATEPPEQRGLRRDGVRLLVATESEIVHTRFAGIGDHLHSGDVLVVNTSATVPGQLDGLRAGEPVVVHVANRLADGTRVIELRTQPYAAAPVLDGHAGERIGLPAGASVELVTPYPEPGSSPSGEGNRLWRGRLQTPTRDCVNSRGDTPRTPRVSEYLELHARPISYGYLRESFPIAAYQTIFALCPGSAEMPSAARPFSTELVARLVARGVTFAPITLHTGVSSQEAHEGPQAEWFEVSPTTADLVNAARRRGGRVVAVGTTATRAIESAAAENSAVEPTSSWTELVITPDRPVRVVNGLVTGWHNPDASHLLLVESVAGPELTQRAYDAAVAERYLWHEFGDSGLLLPPLR